ncbi:TPA: DUF551 domain-containing protein [Salmonella enterica]
MITITKERLLTIQQWRETYGPGSNVVLPAEEAEELARIALASLEAKPIGAFHIAEQQVDGTSDYIKDGEWPIDNGTIEVYATPPAPVVPEEKPMPNHLSMYAVDAVAAIAEVRGWNACRTAMLNGDTFRENPISSTNSPVIPEDLRRAFEAVARLNNEMYCWTFCMSYNGSYVGEPEGLLKRNIREIEHIMDSCRATMLQANQRDLSQPVDPQVAEYEQIMLQAGNSPVTPDGWISCSERMPEQGAYISAVSRHGEYVAGQVIDDWLDLHDGTSFGLDEVYLWMMLPPLPASPQQ